MVPWWRKDPARLPLFPVIIGVTGHRDIAPDALEAVRASVRHLLEDWLFWFDPALCVVSGLADGADQLVAGEALDLGIPLIAVAPMKLSEYRKTLKHPATLDEYWARAALTLELAEVGTPLPADAWPAGHDDRQYEQLGVLLARRSHLLLALWNGVDDPADRCGTCAVVRMRLEGDYGAETFLGSPMFAGAESLIDLTNRGPALQIVTPRLSVAPAGLRRSVSSKPAGTCLLFGLSGDADEPGGALVPPETSGSGVQVEPKQVFATIRRSNVEDFDQIRQLNGQIARFGKSDQMVFQNQVTYLHADDMPASAAGAISVLRRLQAATDAASQAYQVSMTGSFAPAETPFHMLANARGAWRRSGRLPRIGAMFIFASVGPLSVLLFEIYVHHSGDLLGFWALMISLVVFAGASGFYTLYVSREDWQGRFQDYRALAEALRIQFYWAVAAVPAAVSDHYMRNQSREFSWIQFALRGPSLWAAAVADTLGRPHRDAVKNGWIHDQARYFGARGPVHRHASQRVRGWTRTLVCCTIAALILLLVPFWPEGPPGAGVPITWLLGPVREYHDTFVVLVATLPALAAFFSTLGELRAHEAHAHSYGVMHRMFVRAAARADTPHLSDAAFQSLVGELGREALAENAGWLVEHRHRRIDNWQ